MAAKSGDRRPGRPERGRGTKRTRRELTHVGPRGDVRMVDVGEKPVTSREAVATGEITMSAEAVRLIRSGKVKKGDPLQAALAGRNDLEPPAMALVPEIAEAVALLAHQPGVTLARMSGSGATCFALFESDAARDAAVAALADAQPGWWRLVTALI